MQKGSAARSAFLSPRAVIALPLFAAACLLITGTFLGFFRSEAQTNISQRTLTFQERVAYQRAIEDVYWRHRIWPSQRSDLKPSLDAVMSQAQMEKKVADYLRKSQALEDYWQRPITSQQLQGEMDRMAKYTKQSEVLQELFEALGNDSFVIAECLARPALAERLLTNWYGYDQRIHGELKQDAEAELRAHPTAGQMRQTSGTYSAIELIKSDRGETVGQAHRLPNGELPGVAPALQRRDSRRAVKLNSREWDDTVQKLAATFHKSSAVSFGVQRHVAALECADISAHSQNATADNYQTIPLGQLSALQEDETSYYATALIRKTNQGLELATVSWQKEPLESWLARPEHQVPGERAMPAHSYSLPTISGGCTYDNWTQTPGPPDARRAQTAIWTGSEMILWGGVGRYDFFNTGARYNAATDTWAATTSTSAPTARINHTAVWTGTEMIVWGGTDDYNAFPPNGVNSGGRYNPATDTWIATSVIGAPEARYGHAAVWTGTHMIVWGGGDSFASFNTGGKYNPNTDSWTATTTANAPSARGTTAVWTGSEMIVWSGSGDSSGGRYNPANDSWTATSLTNAPAARYTHTAVWTGSEMIVWGGYDGTNTLNTGGKYNPSTDSWTATSTSSAPSARDGHTAVWTGSEMIVWGGGNFLNTGGRYIPGTDSWSPTSTINAPSGRSGHTAIWTGGEMIVWGGYFYDTTYRYLNTGGRYNRSTDSWVATNITNAPSARYRHTAVWTGTEMIVWGGRAAESIYSNTGGKYNPSSDTWTSTSTINAPSGRFWHTAIWSGSEMIVWGGLANISPYDLNTGGRYNPGTDSWTATNTADAPAGREFHTAVWTGNEMIVWGGYSYDGIDHYWNTGGRYNPNTDSWIATSTTNVPSGREDHAAVWTGSEMIVWGGYVFDGDDNYLDTGGRYNPVTDTWIATTNSNVPIGRDVPSGIWTGSKMIIWGGYGESGYLNTGGSYSPGTDSWTSVSITGAPSARAGHVAVWTGSEMIIWGGLFRYYDYYFLGTGARYDPQMNSWATISNANAPAARTVAKAVWTGSNMIVWGGEVASGTATATGGKYCAAGGPTASPTPAAHLSNISTRAFVQTGDNVMIGGFIVQGTQPKRVIIRAIGPELGQYGVPDPLQDPTLELHDGTGALIATNDNWQTTIIGGIITHDQVQEIQDSGYAPGDSRESAIIADLPAGNYTAIIRGVNSTIGVALVEAYDLGSGSASILYNISTRSFVQTGDNVMIGGFIVQGTQPKKVIIRAIGPELSQYGVVDSLQDPTLELHDGTGALIGTNDNWLNTIIGGVITHDQVQDIINSGLVPGDFRESAIIADLPPGNYTAIVRGIESTTGVALVEVYDLH